MFCLFYSFIIVIMCYYDCSIFSFLSVVVVVFTSILYFVFIFSAYFSSLMLLFFLEKNPHAYTNFLLNVWADDVIQKKRMRRKGKKSLRWIKFFFKYSLILLNVIYIYIFSLAASQQKKKRRRKEKNNL